MEPSTPRSQSWQDAPAPAGRVVLVSINPVSAAMGEIARSTGREVVLLAEDEGGAAVASLAGLGLTADDSVVVCDHDAPDAGQVLRDALRSPASYVAMIASRGRSAELLEELRAEGFGDTLARLHVPAGLDTGGKRPGEMALSVVAEIVATSYGRDGGPLRSH